MRRDEGQQWHQLDHMQTICTSLQTDNHINTSSLNFLQNALPDANQQCQSIEGQTEQVIINKQTLVHTSKTMRIDRL